VASRAVSVVVAILALAEAPSIARADTPAPAAAPAAASASADTQAQDPNVVRAREEFRRGSALAKDTQWSDALAAFERANALYSHPLTMFNIAICERALGNYTRARDAFVASQAPSAEHGLPESLKQEAHANQEQIDLALVHATVALDPPDALVLVDGRPLRAEQSNGVTPVLTAGVLPPGAAAPLPKPNVELVLNPGTHLISVTKPGYTNAVVTKTFANGEHVALPLSLLLLPATIHVSSNEADTIVAIDGADMGMAPVDISRHAGTYHVRMTKRGFEPYESDVTVKPGEDANLRAPLAPEKKSVLTKWWFWTGAAAVVAGGVVLTYELTRNPQPPAYQTGTTGWLVTPKSFAW
jgi:hypothetical protein